jgi:hypothetical protein
LAAAAIGLWGAATGCGSDGGKADSYSSITEQISKPTGTVSETTVAKVGEKFETASSNNFMGVRQDDQVAATGRASTTVPCGAGGNVSVSGSGNESSGRVAMKYNDCCFSAGCCASGNGNMFYSSEQSADYNYCASYDMDYSCLGSSASLEYSGCFSLSGKAIMLIDVDGESYAVSGTRSGGTGTLEIRGANGAWTCTFSSGSGSCSSTSGASFSFTAAKG